MLSSVFQADKSLCGSLALFQTQLSRTAVNREREGHRLNWRYGAGDET